VSFSLHCNEHDVSTCKFGSGAGRRAAVLFNQLDVAHASKSIAVLCGLSVGSVERGFQGVVDTRRPDGSEDGRACRPDLGRDAVLGAQEQPQLSQQNLSPYCKWKIGVHTSILL